MSARRKPLRQFNALRGFRAGWRRRVAVLLAGFSLLLQALLPWPAEATSRANGDAPDWVMASLCLAHDSSSQAPAQHPARQDPAFPYPTCAICLGLHCAGAFVPPLLAALSPPRSARTIELVPWTIAVRSESDRTASRARAPPATA
jgi:hypothetical protein